MYKVTPEQIDSILLVIGLSLGEQEAVFNELDFNPYDNYSDGAGDVGGILKIPKRDMENRVEDAQKYPFDYTRFSEARMTEIEAGSTLTDDEIETVKAEYIEECIEDDGSVFQASTEISDGERIISVLYAEQTQGQGGLNIVDFYGFFETAELMAKAMETFEDVIFHDMFP